MANRGMSIFTHNGTDYALNDPNMANEFSTEIDYKTGEHVTYRGNLYVFKTAHDAGAWNGNHVTQVLATGEIESARQDVKEVADCFMQTRNLYDTSAKKASRYVDINTGDLVQSGDYDASDYIPVTVNAKYSTLTGNRPWEMGKAEFPFPNFAATVIPRNICDRKIDATSIWKLTE